MNQVPEAGHTDRPQRFCAPRVAPWERGRFARVRAASLALLIALASAAVWSPSQAAAQTARSLDITVPSGTQLTDDSFDIEIAPQTIGSNQIHVEVIWSRYRLKPPSGLNPGRTWMFFDSTTPQTLALVPHSVSSSHTTTITFKISERVPQQFRKCSFYAGEIDFYRRAGAEAHAEAHAEADGRCWTATRYNPGPVTTQTASVTLAPSHPDISPWDISVSRIEHRSGDDLAVNEGGTTEYDLKIGKRRGAGKTYTVTPRIESIGAGKAVPPGLEITPSSGTWNDSSGDTLTFTVSAPHDDDVVNGHFVIAHDLSGDFVTPSSPLRPRKIHLTSVVIDDDTDYDLIFKDMDGNVIDSTNKLQLPAIPWRDSRDDVYVTVELEHQVSALVTLATQHNPRDYRIPNPYLGDRACSDEPGRLDVPDCTVSRTTYDFEPFIVSATNYAEHRASYHTSMLRFTHGNWNQPVKVYLRTNGDVSIGQDSLLRYAFKNRKTGSVPVEFVDPVDLGLPAIPLPPEQPNFDVHSVGGTSESPEAGLDAGINAALESPQAKYAAMIEWIRADRIADHTDDSKHTVWKRVLKALGDPGYADYPETAMTSAQARARYEGSPWRASWAARGWDDSWDEIWDAIAYAETWTPPADDSSSVEDGVGQTADSNTGDPPPVQVPEITVTAGSGVTEGAAASFTLTASPAPSAPLTVGVDVTAAGDFGAATGTRSVTVPVSGTVAFTVPTAGDGVDEPDGSVTATVQSGAGYTVGAAASGTVAVADDDDPPADNAATLTVAAGVLEVLDSQSGYTDPSVGRPGVPLRFAVTASEVARQDVTVGYTFAARGVSPYFDYCLAPSGADPVGFRCAALPYDPAQPTGTVTIAKGQQTAEIAVVIDPHAWIRGDAQIDLILTDIAGAKTITARIATGNVRR